MVDGRGVDLGMGAFDKTRDGTSPRATSRVETWKNMDGVEFEVEKRRKKNLRWGRKERGNL